MEVINFLMTVDYGIDNWDAGLFAACRKGDLDTAKLMIDKGANDWEESQKIAIEHGHHRIVKLIGMAMSGTVVPGKHVKVVNKETSN